MNAICTIKSVHHKDLFTILFPEHKIWIPSKFMFVGKKCFVAVLQMIEVSHQKLGQWMCTRYPPHRPENKIAKISILLKCHTVSKSLKPGGCCFKISTRLIAINFSPSYFVEKWFSTICWCQFWSDDVPILTFM